jgi:hypothetical protein
MARHIDTVGILWIAMGIFQIVTGLFIGVFFLGLGGLMGGLGAQGGDDGLAVMGGIYAVIGPVVAVLVGVFGLLGVACGVGLRRRAPWARILGFVCAFLSITSIPIGTAIAVFTLVVLFDADAAAEFTGAARAA